MDTSNPWIKEQSNWSDAVNHVMDTAERLKIGKPFQEVSSTLLCVLLQSRFLSKIKW